MQKIKLFMGAYVLHEDRPLAKAGGFGQVFEGEDSAGGKVAIKRLHLSSAEAAHRELRIASELRGRQFENVIPFIDSAEDSESGSYYLVMPVASRSLQYEIEQRGKQESDEVAKVVFQVASGLLEVGELVHRDLKPGNILFHENKWKIADFGIARFFEESTSENSLKKYLSPFYAAPEQFRFERSTHLTDVYSLGCVAYFMLNGQPPFQENPEEHHVASPVPDFSCSDPRLKSLINMMLRKNGETRPSLDRTKAIAEGIVTSPFIESRSKAIQSFAQAGARIASEEQKRQAAREAARIAAAARQQLFSDAESLLVENVGRLRSTILSQVPTASENKNSSHICEIRLGTAILQIGPTLYLPKGAFQRSTLDVLGIGSISIMDFGRNTTWSSSLILERATEGEAVRWKEVSFQRYSSGTYPTAAHSHEDMDMGLSRTLSHVNLAYGPEPIDDEFEQAFHDRWLLLFEKASEGNLRPPSQLPIRSWPPRFA